MMQDWPGQPVAPAGPAPAPAWPGQPLSAQSPANGPRGVRNQNEGNIKDGPFARRQPGYVGSDGTFARFQTPEHGRAAQESLLSNNYLGAGFTTPRSIVSRYSPVGPENSPEAVQNYTAYIARRLGIDPDGQVSPTQVSALAQAMREFETGQTRGGPAANALEPYAALPNAPEPVGQGAPNLFQAGDQLLNKPWLRREPRYVDQGDTRVGPDGVVEVDINTPSIVSHPDGSFEIFDGGTSAYYPATAEEVDRFTGRIERDNKERIARIQREQTPEYRAEYSAARDRSENVPAWLENLLAGQTGGDNGGIVPWLEGGLAWLDPNLNDGDRGLASQAARDASRDRQAALLSEDPVGTIGMQLAGGLLTPGIKGAGDWVGSANGAQRVGRAALVGGVYGGASAAIGAEGGAGERFRQGLLGTATGAAAGGLLDAGAQRAAVAARNRLLGPSPARQLSREGVQLTPGQMLESTPVVGPMIRGVEDGMTGIPLVGSVVQDARNRGVESFNVAALNRALAPIGERLPNDLRPGYGAVEEVQNRLSAAYNRVLPQVSASLDQPFYDDVARVLDNASAEMPEDQIAQLTRVLQNRVFRGLESSDAPISGEQFKRIESELGAMARQYRTANDPAAVSFGEAVGGFQTALRDMIGRQNPAQAERIASINSGYANLVRIERAAGSLASQATEGVFSPTQLGVAVRQGSARAAAGRGGGLLGDLVTSGRQVLPSKIGDSGTATRGAITGLLAGGATLVNPLVAVPTIAATVGAYSKLGQGALNAIYRATDRQTAFSALAELQRFAGRNPALQPYYADALRHVLRAFQSQSPATEQAGVGLLQPTPPVRTGP